MLKKAVQQGRSEQLTIVLPSLLVDIFWDSPDESPTARVQRGSSETARCASTGDSPGPLLADFFSILLEEIADQLYSLFWRGSSMNEMRREIFEQAHPGLVGTQQNHGLLCFQR